MDNASYFISDKALFGSFPKQHNVVELENCGVGWFIDLTHNNESKIKKYTTIKNYINYPIKDKKSPKIVKDFVIFIKKLIKIINQLKEHEKIYIHCRGGHSRSSMVVACLLSIIQNIDINDAITLTRKFHNKRKNLKEKWKKIPHLSNSQLRFIQKLFDNIFFFRAYKGTNITYGLSNYSSHNVTVENLGTFLNAQVAYNALKDINNPEYIQKQLNVKSTYESNKLAQSNKNNEWAKYKYNLMSKVIFLKIQQHTDVANNLLNTGFTKLMYNNKNDYYFGIGDGTGQNLLGNILMNIRKEYTEKLI